MNARRIAGVVAAVSGALLLLSLVLAPFAVSGPFGGWSPMTGPGMMGPGHMGPGMMRGFGAGTSAAPITGAPEVRVTAGDLSFSPSEIRLPARAVNLTLANRSTLPHDLTVPALGVRVVAAPGEIRTVGLATLAVGRYPAYCSVPGHAEAGMRAVVVVE